MRIWLVGLIVIPLCHRTTQPHSDLIGRQDTADIDYENSAACRVKIVCYSDG
jgi:hypothetical protein